LTPKTISKFGLGLEYCPYFEKNEFCVLSSPQIQKALLAFLDLLILSKEKVKFFENYANANFFFSDQLNEIRKTSLARLVCDNVPEITKVQPLAFLNPNQNT
jgi:hypothetical protein